MDVSADHALRHSENDFSKQFLLLVDSGAGVVHVRATEILRAVSCLRKTVLLDKGVYREWDVVNGSRSFTLSNYTDEGVLGDNDSDIGTAFSTPLGAMRDGTASVVTKYFVYLNPHVYMENNPHMHQLLLMYNEYLPSCKVCVVMVTPDMPLPESPASSSILALHFNTPGLTELSTSLRAMVKNSHDEFPEGIVLSDDEVSKVCYAGAGMTSLQFETYLSLATVKAARLEKPTLYASDIADEVQIGKTEIVNSSDILELYKSRDIDDVGGMENLKDWVKKRSKCYSDEARDFGVEPPKGMVLVGLPGCMSGDTVIDYRRGARVGGRPIALRDLHDKFNGIPTSTRGWVDVTEPTYVQSVGNDGQVFFNRVVAVIDSGVKFTKTVTFDDGTTLTLTPEHPMLTTDWEYVETQYLAIGDTVLARGSMKPVAGSGRDTTNRPMRRIINVKRHPYGSTKHVQEGEQFYSYKRVARARLVVEASMNEVSLPTFVAMLNSFATDFNTLRFLPPEYEVHHIDEYPMHDTLSNLAVMSKAEHARLHSKVENFNVEHTRVLTITSIEDHGRIQTYDIEMESPANNFVANGVLVHNSGKSLVAKAIAGELGVPLVRLDFGKVFSSFVGSSEQRMRTALRQIESMAPVVLLADECVSGPTKLRLFNGSEITAEDAYTATTNGIVLNLLGYDPSTGATQPLSTGTIIRHTGKPMLRITSSDGRYIEVTEDHRMLVNREGVPTWITAAEIEESDLAYME